MARAWKTPVNYRSAPSQVVGETFSIVGGVGLLAEAPADPTNPATPIAVTVGGNPRTRVTSAPGVGQYRVRTQTVIDAAGTPRLEYLPVLDFNAEDEGLEGAASYWRTGTVITAEFFDLLRWFLTPLSGIASLSALQTAYPPTLDVTQRGRPGDMAFTTGGVAYYSDGSTWRQLGNVQSNDWSEAVTLAARIGVSPVSAFTAAWTAAQAFAVAHGFAPSSAYTPPGGYTGAQTIAGILGITSTSAFAASWANSQSIAATLGVASAENYSAGGGGDGTDDFNRANGALGSNWTAAPGNTAPTITSNQILGTGSRRAAYYSGRTYANNQWARVVCSVLERSAPALNSGVGACVRQSASADSCYWFSVTVDGGEGVTATTLYRRVSGTDTQIGSSTNIQYGARIEANGTTIRVLNAAGTQIISVTDANLASGSAGIVVTDAGDALDDFTSGDL